MVAFCGAASYGILRSPRRGPASPRRLRPALARAGRELVSPKAKDDGRGLDYLTASGRGQDKQGRHRGAAIPHSQLSWENLRKMWQNMWQHVRTSSKVGSEKRCDPTMKSIKLLV